ncbi:ribonuclease P protein component [Rubellicoccus peritrichatus]|uniref:Ribonuclease P protein component n=1 Tax=Rubellicoccus peritrichatus TaxID=3080537 RepID=A0AAQ3LB24_9BACT|nr:ribonuclease P protein component [Puniceicoccus sp. CR14]WOO41997.1 ribonuclease P protein component [Puniceicoccus sp. CR14]
MTKGGERFRPGQRLRKSAEFNRPRNLGFTADCAGFVCRILPPMDPEAPPVKRLGLIASRRVGNAVIRNRAKRLLREIFRKNQAALPEACDVIIVVRSSYARYDYHNLEARFLKACKRFAEQ